MKLSLVWYASCIAALYASQAVGSPIPPLASASAIVGSPTNPHIFLAKQSNRPFSVASLSKLMSAMVVLDAHQDPSAKITITQEDVDTMRHSKSHLLVGATLSRGELLQLALMASENRATHALARTYPGGIKAFVAAMNRKATRLHLGNTHFVEPTGLSAQNISNAADMLHIVAAATTYPEIKAATTTSSRDIALTARYAHHFINTDALVRTHQWPILLSKTGYIKESGHCLAIVTEINHQPVIMVFLNSQGESSSLGDAARVRQWLSRKV